MGAQSLTTVDEKFTNLHSDPYFKLSKIVSCFISHTEERISC